MVGLTGLPQCGVGDGGMWPQGGKAGKDGRAGGHLSVAPRAEPRLGDPQGRSAKRLALEWEPRKRVP